jgi:hypothetical protein
VNRFENLRNYGKSSSRYQIEGERVELLIGTTELEALRIMRRLVVEH